MEMQFAHQPLKRMIRGLLFKDAMPSFLVVRKKAKKSICNDGPVLFKTTSRVH